MQLAIGFSFFFFFFKWGRVLKQNPQSTQRLKVFEQLQAAPLTQPEGHQSSLRRQPNQNSSRSPPSNNSLRSVHSQIGKRSGTSYCTAW